MIHLALHAAVPLALALSFYRGRWPVAFALMMVGMLIDVDHLLATPVYDAGRCSVGFHPLHTLVPAGLYLAAFVHERTRLIGLGLLVHLALDSIDCQVTNGVWWV